MSRSLSAAAALLCAVASPVLAQSRASALYQIPCPPGFEAHCDAILPGGYDLLPDPDHNHQILQVVVPPGRETNFLLRYPHAEFLRRGRPFREIALERAAEDGAPEMVGDDGYYTVQEIEDEIASIAAAHPFYASMVDLTELPGAAKTHDGRSIYALKLSDRASIDEDEPAIVIAAQHHARELNSPHMVIGAMRRMVASLRADSVLSNVLATHEVWFVPMVNPDGVNWVWEVDNFWRKNRRNNGDGTFGVDLNRNYPARWGGCGTSTNTSSQVYLGTAPASEPETRTMIALREWLNPEIYIDFHSSGREVLFTYPPCSTTLATLRNYLQGFADDLRAPMSYATRPPSASGETPEEFWQNGTLSFLVEISTSFQPQFTDTEAEEDRVWPGLERMLTTWRPPLRGHVRSALDGSPVEAEISYTPNLLIDGERVGSRPRDGRYALWIPPGNFQVTYSAPGYQSVVLPLELGAGDRQTRDVFLPPLASAESAEAATLDATSGDGGDLEFALRSPEHQGLYWIALTGAPRPGISLGDLDLPLQFDRFALWSLSGPDAFQGAVGTLQGGAASARLRWPLLPETVDQPLWALGILLDPSAPQGVAGRSQLLRIR